MRYVTPRRTFKLCPTDCLQVRNQITALRAQIMAAVDKRRPGASREEVEKADEELEMLQKPCADLLRLAKVMAGKVEVALGQRR